ncbi:hypothetical protein [Nocardioides rubriscoriae]|uniref:hypothetical protein n=1 Tax=Nocardioides rubriscoriae TaxID=642762 RepID=UPI0011DF4099|nr:hypothetical protein [Nocardioides rubriscoriae]
MARSDEWRAAVVALNPDVSLSMGELVAGWDSHIRRIIAELDAKQNDQTVWGIYDFIAALHLRDAVERGLKALHGSPFAAAFAEVAALDQRFVDHTERDHHALLHAFLAAEQPRSDAWWWHRVPTRGPIRFDLSG